jgi:hypothetical protein
LGGRRVRGEGSGGGLGVADACAYPSSSHETTVPST